MVAFLLDARKGFYNLRQLGREIAKTSDVGWADRRGHSVRSAQRNAASIAMYS